MKRIRIIHRLRVALALLVFCGLVAAGGTLWWANHTGLPESWRSGIEEALSASGLHADLGSLRYLPLRGIEARDVVVYSDSSHERVLARLDNLFLDIDRTKLSRGDFSVERLDLSGARVTLAVDPDDPASKKLEISGARGRIQFSGPREIEISRVSGMVGGLRLEGQAMFSLYRPDSTGTLEDMERARAERRRTLIAIIDAIDTFDLEATAPPRLRIDARGDLEVYGSLRAKLDFRAANLTSRGIDIRRLDVDGEVRGSTLALHRIDLETPAGSMSGKLEYELDGSGGRFELQSSADLPAVVEQVGIPIPDNAPRFDAPPVLDAYGSFRSDADGWHLHIIGDAELTGPRVLHLSADRLETRFSMEGTLPHPSADGSPAPLLKQGRLLLEDLEIQEGPHSLTGRAFVTSEKIRYEFSTDLPVDYWQRSIKLRPLAQVLDDFSATEATSTRVEASGVADLLEPKNWHFTGRAESSGIAYRGVPSRYAEVQMDLRHAGLDFTAGKVDFDYADYRLKKAHGGPSNGSLTVDRIFYDNVEKTVGIKNLRGKVWPAPIVRTFAKDIADELEVYRFHRPPTLSADGRIGIGPGLPRQDLTVGFSSDSPASYAFLDKDLLLSRPRGTVRVLPDKVRISDLDTGLMDGRIRGDFEQFLGGRPKLLKGEIDWTSLSLPEIATTYDFESSPKGLITGRMDFQLSGTDVSGLSGSGNILLEEGELFEVPIFGPLSPVISVVLGRRKAGFQEANEAFCTFDLEKGVLSTADFFTSTPSIHFTGDGRADLAKDQLDMTIRMNARGLFGFITLPLRPIYEGLFQFRGSGPIDKPEWRTVSFTSPPDDQKARLLEPPKARPVGAPPRARVVSPR